jgi:hypothetical protein
MRAHVRGLAGVAALAPLLFAVPGPAEARIKCQGNFQETKYGLISTPYCEEEQIARVAQSYGWKVSGNEVRNNPLKKVRLCQLFGDDVRLKGSCGAYSRDLYGR